MSISFSKKNWAFFICSAAVVVIGAVLAPIGSLSQQGNAALFFMAALVFLLTTQVLSPGLIGIVAIVGLPVLGLTTLGEASALFGNQLFFYLCACYAISIAMEKYPLAKRILRVMLKSFGKTTKGIITAFMLATTILSTFISNFPCAMLMLIIAKIYLSFIEDPADRKQTQKSLVIGILFGAVAGGMMTPVGNSNMILASTFLASAGYPISFVQWMVFGVPVGFVVIFLARFFLFKLFPPVEQNEEQRIKFINEINGMIPDKFDIHEIITIIIMAATFTCWVMNFNLMLITCLCGVFLLFPGFGLMTWDEFNKGSGWGTNILVCSLTAVVTVLQQVGVMDWLISFLNSAIPNEASPMLILLILCSVAAVVLIVMPQGIAINTILGPSIIMLAISMGLHPATMAIGFATLCTSAFILPTETMVLVFYDGGANFNAKDLLSVGTIITVVEVLAIALWHPISAKILGLTL